MLGMLQCGITVERTDRRQTGVTGADTVLPASLEMVQERCHQRSGPVNKAVFDYTVGGMNVIGSWFKYRKKNPGGKRTSPLDDIHVTERPHEWSLEFTGLLTVLARLVSLEPQQAALLEEILAGEVATMAELTDAGVAWPQTRDDRKPRRKPANSDPNLLDGLD